MEAVFRKAELLDLRSWLYELRLDVGHGEVGSQRGVVEWRGAYAVQLQATAARHSTTIQDGHSGGSGTNESDHPANQIQRVCESGD